MNHQEHNVGTAESSRIKSSPIARLKSRLHAAANDDQGMATTEYALVTVAAAGFAGVLIVLLNSPEVRDLLMGIVTSALG